MVELDLWGNVMYTAAAARNPDAAILLRSAQIYLLNTKLQHTTVENITLMHASSTSQSVSTHAKHNSIASRKKSISQPEPSSSSPRPGKKRFFLEIRTFKPHALLAAMTCKTQSESQDSTAEEVPLEKGSCSHSTAICTD